MSFTVYTFHQTLLRRSMDDDELGRTLTYTKFYPENWKGRHHLRDLNIDGMIVMNLRQRGDRM